MALPRTISGVSFANIHYANVYRAPNGNHYAPFLVSGVLVMYSADNGDNTWAEVDSAGNPSETAINSLAAVLIGTVIHIVTGDNATSPDYLYHTFDTSTNEWVIVDEVIENNVDTDVASTTHSLGIAVRSDGSVVVVCVGDSDAIMSVNYSRVDYVIRSSGGTWGTRTTIDDGGSVYYYAPLCILGAGDKVHIFYTDETNLIHKSLNSSNSLSAAENVNDASVSLFYIALPVYYDSSGNEIIFFAWRDFSGADIEYSRSTNDGTWAAAATASDFAVGVGTLEANVTIAAHGTDIHVLYEENSTNDLWFASDTGAGFGTDVEVIDASTINRVKGNIYTRDNGDVVFGYIYLNSTTVLYGEYLIEEAPSNTDVTPASADTTSSASIGNSNVGLASDTADVVSSAQIGAIAITSIPAPANSVSSADFGSIDASLTPSEALVTSSASVGDVNRGTVVHPTDASATSNAEIGVLGITLSPESASAVSDANVSIAKLLLPEAASATSSAEITAINLAIVPDDASGVADASHGTIDVTIAPDNASTVSSADVGNVLVATVVNPDAAIVTGSADLDSIVVVLSPDGAIANSAASVGNATINVTLLPDEALATSDVDGALEISLTPDGAVANSDAAVGSISISLFADSADSISSSSIELLEVLLTPDEANAASFASVGNVENSADSNVDVTPSPAVATSSGSISNLSLNNTPESANATSSADVTFTLGLTVESASAQALADRGNISLSLSADEASATSFTSISTIAIQLTITDDAVALPDASVDLNVSIGPEVASVSATAEIAGIGRVSRTDAALVNATASLAELVVNLSPVEAVTLSDASGNIVLGSRVISDAAITITSASVGDVFITETPSPVVQYLGELGRYKLYDGAFADDYTLYEGVLGQHKRYKGMFSENDYSLYQGTLGKYILYKGSIQLFDSEGNMITKLIVGETLSPKFTLTIGDDHEGTYTEPDTVTMTVTWGDGTISEFSTGDEVNPVTLASTPGVYYIATPAAIEGTIYVYALATWNDPAWAVAKNRQYEIVGEFETA